MPNEQQAAAETGSQTPESGVHLGISVSRHATSAAPVTKASWLRPSIRTGQPLSKAFAAAISFSTSAARPVADVQDVRNAIKEAKAQGKHDVLMRVKSAKATTFVAVPVDKA